MEQEHTPLESNHFTVCPRCHGQVLTNLQLEQIAESAAEKAVELFRAQFYQGLGAAIFNRFLMLLGIIVVSVALWLSSRGILK